MGTLTAKGTRLGTLAVKMTRLETLTAKATRLGTLAKKMTRLETLTAKATLTAMTIRQVMPTVKATRLSMFPSHKRLA